ncbi:MAG: hypothetical protein P8R42_04680 [Candidatus Binatia bacterium]|nr:hypothetical protein [Candidatus Binatia bacterium]
MSFTICSVPFSLRRSSAFGAKNASNAKKTLPHVSQRDPLSSNFDRKRVHVCYRHLIFDFGEDDSGFVASYFLGNSRNT